MGKKKKVVKEIYYWDEFMDELEKGRIFYTSNGDRVILSKICLRTLLETYHRWLEENYDDLFTGFR